MSGCFKEEVGGAGGAVGEGLEGRWRGREGVVAGAAAFGDAEAVADGGFWSFVRGFGGGVGGHCGWVVGGAGLVGGLVEGVDEEVE